MQPKKIIFAPNAEKEIKKLTKQAQRSVIKTLRKWSSGEGTVEIEKLRSQPDFFRLRAGNIRVIYYPISGERVVLLLIRDRKHAYKNLGNLPERLDSAMKNLRVVGR